MHTRRRRLTGPRWIWGPLGALIVLLVGCGDGSLFTGERLDSSVQPRDSTVVVLTDGDLNGDGPPWWKCVESSAQVELRPLDMVVGLDVSQSMIYPPEGVEYPDKWTSVREALKTFVSAPGMSGAVGLEYFPEYPRCKADVYEQLDVDMAQLPTEASTLVASLSAKEPNPDGGTPLVQVLQGLLAKARAHAKSEPDHKVIMVLATDGAPQGCQDSIDGDLPNTIDNAKVVAKSAVTGSPSVPVFVIGVGDLDVLDAIAESGGTEKALIVGTGQGAADLQETFAQALDDIRGRAIFCDYEIPTPEIIDFKRINVRYTHGGTTEDFVFVRDAGGCSTSGQSDVGWYFDDPDDPHQIKLCGGSCDKVQDAIGGQVDLVFGCKTIIP